MLLSQVRRPDLKSKYRNPPMLTERQRLEKLVAHFEAAPKTKPIRKKKRKLAGKEGEDNLEVVDKFRRRYNLKEAQRVFRYRHPAPARVLSWRKVALLASMPVMSAMTLYKRFVANNQTFVDRRQFNGHWQRGKLAGPVKDFLLSQECLQSWSGYSLLARCQILRLEKNISIQPSGLRKFYLRNGVRSYALTYTYQQSFDDPAERERKI